MRPATREEIAVHEAGHAVVAAELGGGVSLIVVDAPRGEGPLAAFTWPPDPLLCDGATWEGLAATAQGRTAVRRVVTAHAAGRVAERMVRPDLEPLSVTITPADFARGGWVGLDQFTVVWLLCKIRRPRVAEVLAAERRAGALLRHRWARVEAVASAALETGRLEGEDLARALGR